MTRVFAKKYFFYKIFVTHFSSRLQISRLRITGKVLNTFFWLGSDFSLGHLLVVTVLVLETHFSSNFKMRSPNQARATLNLSTLGFMNLGSFGVGGGTPFYDRTEIFRQKSISAKISILPIRTSRLIRTWGSFPPEEEITTELPPVNQDAILDTLPIVPNSLRNRSQNFLLFLRTWHSPWWM